MSDASVRAGFPRVSSELLCAAFQECDHSNNERLEGAEIEEFLRRLLKRPELEEIFHRYSGEDRVLSAPELLEFLEDQGEDGVTLAHAQKLIHTYELNETGGGLTDGVGVHAALSRHLTGPGFQLRGLRDSRLWVPPRAGYLASRRLRCPICNMTW